MEVYLILNIHSSIPGIILDIIKYYIHVHTNMYFTSQSNCAPPGPPVAQVLQYVVKMTDSEWKLLILQYILIHIYYILAYIDILPTYMHIKLYQVCAQQCILNVFMYIYVYITLKYNPVHTNKYSKIMHTYELVGLSTYSYMPKQQQKYNMYVYQAYKILIFIRSILYFTPSFLVASPRPGCHTKFLVLCKAV